MLVVVSDRQQRRRRAESPAGLTVLLRVLVVAVVVLSLAVVLLPAGGGVVVGARAAAAAEDAGAEVELEVAVDAAAPPEEGAAAEEVEQEGGTLNLGDRMDIPEPKEVSDFPWFWGDVAYEMCKRYESTKFRKNAREEGDLPILPDHLKGACGTLQDTVEGYCEYKQALAFRDNHTSNDEVAAGSSNKEVQHWGRAIMSHFIVWIFDKWDGELQNLRFSTNNAFQTWFDSVLTGEIPEPPAAQDEDGQQQQQQGGDEEEDGAAGPADNDRDDVPAAAEEGGGESPTAAEAAV